MQKLNSQIADKRLASEGARKVDWVLSRMPILENLRSSLEESKPFRDLGIGICLHVEPKTAVWLEVLKAGGASISITGSPGTTDDSIAAYLSETLGIRVFAKSDESFEQQSIGVQQQQQ